MKNSNVVSVSDPPFLTTGAASTSASTASQSSSGSAVIQQVNLLAGLVTADEATSVSTSGINSQGQVVESAAGSVFSNLIVLGVPITSTPAPNTVIALPLLGQVTLNEQKVTQTSTSASLTVNMIHISITLSNVLGYPVGTQIIVANAYSEITQVPAPAALGGVAYGTQVLATLLASGETAPAILPCTGTGGQTITKTLTGVSVPPIVSSGVITDTAEGTVTTSLVSGQTSSTVAGANLLVGVITATVLQDQANASTTDGVHFTFTSSGALTGIFVLGHPEITDSTPPNTEVDLAGFGTLYVHRVITTKVSVEVRMLEVVINQVNVLDLPIGTDIRVCDSLVSLQSASNP